MKDILARRKQAERRERITRILGAGRNLFLRKGYASTTMRDICEAAELSTGAVYFYFSGKDEIYASICEESFHVLLDMFDTALKETTAPLERLHAMKSAYLAFYTDHHERWVMLNSGFRNAGLPDELFKTLEALDHRGISLLHDTVSALLDEKNIAGKYDSRKITMALWASAEGLLTLHNQKYFEYTQTTLEEMLNMQIAIFLRGLQ